MTEVTSKQSERAIAARHAQLLGQPPQQFASRVHPRESKRLIILVLILSWIKESLRFHGFCRFFQPTFLCPGAAVAGGFVRGDEPHCSGNPFRPRLKSLCGRAQPSSNLGPESRVRERARGKDYSGSCVANVQRCD